MNTERKEELDKQPPASSGVSDLLSWNNLIYTMPITNSLASARNLKSYPADQSLYKQHDTIVFTCQTGAQYVDWTKSFLYFTIDVDAASHGGDPTHGFHWGRGSVLNLFESVVVTTRSGVEIQRMENFNRKKCLEIPYKSPSWIRTWGSTIAYNDDQDTTLKLTTAPVFSNYVVNGSDNHYCIPISLLGGVFDSPQLMPAMLASGLRIEIRLENGAVALCMSDHTAPADNNAAFENLSYSVVNPGLLIDTTLLNDAASRELRMTSARNGLEYVYKQSFHQKEAQSASSSTNMVVSKAVSRALNVKAAQFISKRKDVRFDNFCTCLGYINHGGSKTMVPSVPLKFQYRLGSQYYPNQPLTTTRQMYANALYSNEVPMDGTTSSISVVTYARHRTLDATFEKSALLRYSGVSINNSRTLSLSAEFMPNSNDPNTEYLTTEVCTWLEYVSIAKCFLNNVVVSV